MTEAYKTKNRNIKNRPKKNKPKHKHKLGKKYCISLSALFICYMAFFVVVNTFGEKRSFQTVLNKRMKSLGFNVCLHELRHTYATKLIASGVDFKTAAYILGHDVKETMNTYTHVTDSMLMNAKNIINSNFENLDI